MKSRDKLEDIVRKDLDVRASDGTYDRMRDIVLGMHGPARTTESAATLNITGRTIMRNPMAKVAVAAAILIALGLGVSVFVSTGSHSGVVWAQVADRVDACRGFIYQECQTQTRADRDRPTELRMIRYECPAHGSRMESYSGDRLIVSGYSSYDEGVSVTLYHDMKRYQQRTVPAAIAADVAGGTMAKAMIQQFTFGGYKELGRRTIDGVEAEGIETENPLGFGGNFQVDSHTAQLWVSVETGYPVLIESEVIGNEGTVQIKMVMDEFQWDVEFDPSEFTPEIPPDYEPLETHRGGGMRGGMGGEMRGEMRGGMGWMGGGMGAGIRGGMRGSSDGQ
jgi:hypothetical protein